MLFSDSVLRKTERPRQVKGHRIHSFVLKQQVQVCIDDYLRIQRRCGCLATPTNLISTAQGTHAMQLTAGDVHVEQRRLAFL